MDIMFCVTVLQPPHWAAVLAEKGTGARRRFGDALSAAIEKPRFSLKCYDALEEGRGEADSQLNCSQGFSPLTLRCR